MSLSMEAVAIVKSYNGSLVLRDCSWTFDKTGTYVLTGANGSGKSTFLRICALLEQPDRGIVHFRDADNIVTHGIGLMRRISLVLPKAALFNTSVQRNVSYGLRVRGISEKEAASRINGVLEFVGLSHKKDQNALTLSSGEAQRIALARALILEPEVLFLDEPTASVDEKNTSLIEDIIYQLKESGRTTIIMTTHDRAQAERLADRVLRLDKGRIV